MTLLQIPIEQRDPTWEYVLDEAVELEGGVGKMEVDDPMELDDDRDREDK